MFGSYIQIIVWLYMGLCTGIWLYMGKGAMVWVFPLFPFVCLCYVYFVSYVGGWEGFWFFSSVGRAFGC